MILCVDIGNTRIKWACANEGSLHGHGQARYDQRDENVPLTSVLDELWARLTKPKRVLIVNVAGADVAQRIQSWVAARWAMEIELVRSVAAGWGVTNAYTTPDALGADRWAALVAAHRRYRVPVCVVDGGTALTVDALGADGVHLGGLILPGVSLMRRALGEHTWAIGQSAGLPRLELATNTSDAVAAGAAYAVVATIEKVLGELENRLGETPRCVLTGGDGALLQGVLRTRCDRQDDLVLQGLVIMAGSDS